MARFGAAFLVVLRAVVVFAAFAFAGVFFFGATIHSPVIKRYQYYGGFCSVVQQFNCAYGRGLVYWLIMTKQKQKRPRTYARNRAAVISRRGYEKVFESDSAYFLKLVALVMLGTLWLRFAQPITWLGIPLNGVPIGLFIGLLLVRRFEHYQMDRKIWYAVLIVVTIVCYFYPTGVSI